MKNAIWVSMANESESLRSYLALTTHVYKYILRVHRVDKSRMIARTITFTGHVRWLRQSIFLRRPP